ncbi:MAG: D-alanyl-D-alanine carboxypeptidase family protein [Pseudomonadota bacterium]
MLRIFLFNVILFISHIALGFETEAKHAILMDYDTKTVLYEKQAFAHMPPSSMSKMMTAYIAFEHLKNGNVQLEDSFNISEKAWRMGGTRMFIPLSKQVTFEELLKGVIVQSGNDAAVAIAEILAGSEEEFVNRMNETAKRLGMNDSNFTNPTGWPEENNYSTANDLAILAIRTIQDFPQYYHYYSETEFIFNQIKQGNRNGLLYRNIGADGLKTGHTDMGGYGLTGSIKKGDRRLVVVVNGLSSNKARTNAAENLINYGLMNYNNIKIIDEGAIVDKIKVINGRLKEVNLVSKDKIVMTLPKSETKKIQVKIHYNTPAMAPIQEGDVLGELIVEMPTGNKTYPLYAGATVYEASLFERMQHNFSNLFD